MSAESRKTELARTIGTTMRELRQSDAFNSTDWRLFYSLACRLQPGLARDEAFQPEPLIEELGFRDVAAFVLAPTKSGGLEMDAGKWEALLVAAKMLKDYPELAHGGYSMLSMANLASMPSDHPANRENVS